MAPLATLLGLLLANGPGPIASSPAAPPPGGPVILFLVDNSASLPPLDPDEKRVAALEKIFSFLQGQRYRLVLFGGRREIFVDDTSRYRNNGRWTDFYFAFDRARELVKEHPPGTDFRIILLTDAIIDPDPADWQDQGLPRGEDVRAHSIRKLLPMIEAMRIPLYVILVGEPAREGVRPGDVQQAPGLVLDMVRAANGVRAAPAAQSLASFFGDDGVLLKKFVYRVEPQEGLKKIEPVVRRIVAPSRPSVELGFLGALVLPMGLFLVVLLGLLVRSFPGPGDLEIVELSLGVPVHLAVDRLHKVERGGWGTTGLSMVANARDAVATVTYQPPGLDLTGVGLDASQADPLTRALLPLGVDDLKKAVERYAEEGTREEKIFALNLDYMAKNMTAPEAERILTSAPADRRRLPLADFLRAKAHLITDDVLRRKLLEPRAQIVGYGKERARRDLVPGAAVRVGRYGFIVKDVARGGRKDARLSLYYDRVPSLLGLKTVLPGGFQRAFRFRRSSQRVVS
ncbi:MAG TPA: VWA domain-containing protein [Vicinamibacteria bacterium]|nr:VWA domain-containing protein [Vicinamibacteria bacterium]